jgi:hypothetical protein
MFELDQMAINYMAKRTRMRAVIKKKKREKVKLRDKSTLIQLGA